METIESLATVKARLSEFVDSAQRTHERVIITKNGRPAALLMSVEDYESLLETLDVLSDPETMSKLRQAQREVDAGEVVALETAAADLDARIASEASDRPEPRRASAAEDGDADDTPAPTA